MATVIRKRYNSVLCSTSKPTLGASLTNSGTTITFAAALKKSDGSTDIPTLGTDEYLPIILEPDTSAEEIVYLTAYTAGATTGTISRGQEGSAGVAHSNGVSIAFGPTAADFDGKDGGSGLIGLTSYAPGSDSILSVTNTSLVDFDATNLLVTFTTPPSGKVLIRVSAFVYLGGTADYGVFGLRESTTQVGPSEAVTFGNTLPSRCNAPFLVTGLTPGSSHTYKLAARSATGTMYVEYGPNRGPVVMEVWAVNL